MKILKYIVIILAAAIVFYSKSKIDTRNKENIQTIDDLDEGTDAPLTISKKGSNNTP